MQTLSEFVAKLKPSIKLTADQIGAKFEAGKDMSAYALIEPNLREAVDELCYEYAENLRVSEKNSRNPQVLYLFHHRLMEGILFADWLESHGFADHQRDAEDWLCFLTIEAWDELLAERWRAIFLAHYRRS